MPWKVVEWTFRRLPVVLLPIALTPLLAIFVVTSYEDTYVSEATVWVSEPAGIGSFPLGDENNFVSPAQRQSRVLQDLLITRSFRRDIAEEAGLLPATAASADVMPESKLEAAEQVVAQSVGTSSAGFNVLKVSATSTDPFLAQALVQGVISSYVNRLSEEGEFQTTSLIAYFTQQAELAELELQLREADLNTYLAAHPEADDPGSTDLEYQSLLSRVGAQDRVLSDLQQQVQGLYLDAATAGAGQAVRFRVQDGASLPSAALGQSLTRTVGLPVAGVIVGLFVAAAYVYVAYRADHTIRSGEDLQGLRPPLLGFVPEVSATQNQPFYRRFRLPERDFARRLAASLTSRSR